MSMIQHIYATVQELEESLRSLSSRKKLMLILLAGAIVRSFFHFVTHDSQVYHLWLDRFTTIGSLPFPDHPPLYFLLAAGVQSIVSAAGQLSIYLYWWLPLIPLGIYYQLRGQTRPVESVLVTYILLYTATIGWLGTSYEIATLVSFFSGMILICSTYVLGSTYSEQTGIYSALFCALAWWPIVYSTTMLLDMTAAALIALTYLAYRPFNETESIHWRSYATVTLLFTAALFTKYYSLLFFLPLIIGIAATQTTIWQTTRALIPAALGTTLFLIWTAYNNVSLLSHYASTHFLYLQQPSVVAYGTFVWTVITPGLLIAAIAGAYISLTHPRTRTALGMILLPFTAYIIQSHIMHRSHYLINLSNYMLPALPFILVLAAKGWTTVLSKLRFSTLLTVLFAISLAFPVFSGQSIQLEYDDGYTVPSGNSNTMTRHEINAQGLDPDPMHYIYSFTRQPTIQTQYTPKQSYIRWNGPQSATVVAEEPDTYTVTLQASQQTNVTIHRDNRPVHTVTVDDATTVNMTLPEGRTDLTFSWQRPVYITVQDNDDHPTTREPPAPNQITVEIAYSTYSSPGNDDRHLSAWIDTIYRMNRSNILQTYNIGTPTAEPVLLDGWFGPETNDHGTGRWTGDTNRDGTATARFMFETTSGTSFTMTATAIKPMEATVHVDSEPVQTLTLSRDRQNYTVLIPQKP